MGRESPRADVLYLLPRKEEALPPVLSCDGYFLLRSNFRSENKCLRSSRECHASWGEVPFAWLLGRWREGCRQKDTNDTIGMRIPRVMWNSVLSEGQ